MYSFKKLLLTALFLFVAIPAFAQVPQGFNFQAVARGTDGLPLVNQQIGVQVQVLKGAETGTVVYTESHQITSSEVGLMTLVIGEGTPAESNDFSSINWSDDNYFVKLATDVSGGTDYEDLGTSRLLSVPYALMAENVVNGTSGSIPLNLNLNNNDPDSSFVINLTGSGRAAPLQVFSASSNYNAAVWGEAVSDENNVDSQRGVFGRANGMGTGSHIGVFGDAVNFEATGASRRGVYGQAASKAKFNQGVIGIAVGEGNGEGETDPENGDFGSFNLGGYFQASGNLNGNVGVEGRAIGEAGSLRNFGVLGSASATSDAVNIGIRSEARNSNTLNIGFDSEVNGGSVNRGMILNVGGGTSNIGMEVNADTAAILRGYTLVEGDLMVTGSINGASGGSGSAATSYQLNTSNPDSSFTIDLTGPVSGSALIATSSTDGVNAGIEGKAQSGTGNAELQVGTYGESSGSGTGLHLGVYGVATGDESASGDVGRRYGLYGSARSTGRENIGGFGIGRGAGDGEIVALGDENISGSFNVGGFNIGLVGFARDNVNGNIGVRGYVYGDQGARENRAVSAEAVSTASGRNVGVQALVNNSQTANIAFQALMFDNGNASERNHGLDLDISNSATIMNRGIYANVNGSSPDNHGMQIDVSGGTNSNIGLIVNAPIAAELNGDVIVAGTLTATSVNQTSDERLKTNIQPLENALHNITNLRGVSYNWKDDNRSADRQIGLIAQEVEEILPEFVHTDADGMKSVNYSQMVAVLIEAVRELNQKVVELEETNSALVTEIDRNSDLEKRIRSIEQILRNYSGEINAESDREADR